MIRFVARTYPPCWALKARIQIHRGKPLLFHDKCPGFFYVHYTTGLRPILRTKQLWLSVLLKDTSAATIEAVLPTLPMLCLSFNVYLDSNRVSILIEAVLPTLPMLYLPFNVHLDSKRISILIEAVLPTLPMLYLPFNVYLDSKRVSILIEAVLPTLPMLCLSFNVYLDSNRVLKYTHRSSLANITNVVPSLQCLS